MARSVATLVATLAAVAAAVALAATPAGADGISAHCTLEATLNGGSAAGSITFAERASDGLVDVHITMTDIPPTDRVASVHVYGDVSDPDAANVGDPMNLTCASCPVETVPATVGLLANGDTFTSGSDATLDMTYVDNLLMLHGPNSVIGRSIVVYSGATTTTPKVAQCVVGLAGQGDTLRNQRVIGRATCNFKGTDNEPGVSGQLTIVPSTDRTHGYVNGAWLQWDLSGLFEGLHGFHAHMWGDVSDTASALAVGGHYLGAVCREDNPCRTPGVPQEVGMLLDGAGLTANGAGDSTGTAFDPVLRLAGEDSLLGRSLVIHGNSADGAPRVAQCVIGEAAPLADPSSMDPVDCVLGDWGDWSACTCDGGNPSFRNRERSIATPAAWNGNACTGATVESELCDAATACAGTDRTTALCVLSTANSTTPITGTLTFEDLGDGQMTVTANVNGLSAGDHGFHVHEYGDISDTAYAMSTGGHFVGDCNGCRTPASKPQEAGLLNNGEPLVSDGNTATVTFTETVAALSGVNSIIGRSIVIHGNADNAGTRVAQCVIGREDVNWAQFNFDTPLVRPAPQAATCLLTPTSNADDQSLTGRVTFFPPVDGSAGLAVSVSVSGLYSSDVNAALSAHGMHVHTKGDISDTTGLSAGGHFIGDCSSANPCRPTGLQEVGYVWDGVKIGADSGPVVVTASDSVLQLDGKNSIVGRSVIIHGDSTGTGPVVARCVIGEAKPAPDGTCEYSEWSEWTGCQCGWQAAGTRSRGRSILAIPASGSSTCTAAAQSEGCDCPTLPNVAQCVLSHTNVANDGVRAGGSITFEEQSDGSLTVSGSLSGLSTGFHSIQVNSFGDITDKTGAATGPLYVGTCDSCRSAGASAQAVGLLNDGTVFTASGSGDAPISFTETVATVRGANSILGRSVVVLGTSSSATAIVAQCAIGVKSMSHENPLPSPPTSHQASCKLVPTSGADSQFLGGSVSFVGANNPDDGVYISWSGSWLDDGLHGMHVHDWGDISGASGSTPGGHFVGACDGCRPAGTLQEVGYLFGASVVAANNDGAASGGLLDPVPRLDAAYASTGIVGRSIVVHGSRAGSGPRVAQCVIGMADPQKATACAFGPWSDWSACECGGTALGSRARSSSVVVSAIPAMSEGCSDRTETGVCDACPAMDCAVSEWDGWSDCTQACGGGSRERFRTVTQVQVYPGAECPALYELATCNTAACPLADGFIYVDFTSTVSNVTAVQLGAADVRAAYVQSIADILGVTSDVITIVSVSAADGGVIIEVAVGTQDPDEADSLEALVVADGFGGQVATRFAEVSGLVTTQRVQSESLVNNAGLSGGEIAAIIIVCLVVVGVSVVSIRWKLDYDRRMKGLKHANQRAGQLASTRAKQLNEVVNPLEGVALAGATGDEEDGGAPRPLPT